MEIWNYDVSVTHCTKNLQSAQWPGCSSPGPTATQPNWTGICRYFICQCISVLAFPSKLIIQLTGSDRNGCENHYQVSVLLDCKISHGLAIKPLQIYQASSYFRLVSSIHHWIWYEHMLSGCQSQSCKYCPLSSSHSLLTPTPAQCSYWYANWTRVRSRAGNKPSRRLKFHNHGGGPWVTDAKIIRDWWI